MAHDMAIPEAWRLCPCGGECSLEARDGLVGIGRRIVLRIRMKCRLCGRVTVHDDAGMVLYE